ncbi:right-handed parallel beta-helix repeat-containing protein [bacterium]|nr:right-handed parallel beta-helix repeat-containing protein [bacterium]
MIIFILVLVLLSSCSQNASSDYDLPEECGGKCYEAHDINSLQDALIDSAAAFSNCICLGSGVFEGSVTVSKPLRLFGRKDGSTYLKSLAIADVSGVILRDFSFKNISTGSAALFISGSSVKMDNISFSGISASSVFGGRGIVVSGEESDVLIKNSKIDHSGGTGILINGAHRVSLENVTLSKCGFAALWVQNQSDVRGILSVSGSTFSDNGAVAVEILGNTSLQILGSSIEGVKKRDVMLESVGDGIVVKNSFLSEAGSVTVEDSSISGFPRAGIILDGAEGSASIGAIFKNLSVFSDNGSFGLVVQNAVENASLREGFTRNDFSLTDMKREEELFIIDTFFDLQ